MELLLGADDQIEQRQMRLQARRHPRALDEAVLAVPVSGEAPEIGPVVDVQRRAAAKGPGEPQRLEDRRLSARMAQMRAGRDDGPGLGDEVGIDVVLAQRHVGAVLPVEDQRELPVVPDAEQDQRGEALGIGPDAAHVDAFARQLLPDEAAHVLVADPRDERGPEPSRAAPAAILVGEPPMYFWNEPMSSSRRRPARRRGRPTSGRW